MELVWNLKSPIEEEAARQFEMIRPSLSSNLYYDICQYCGKRSNVGIYECMTGSFKCADCVKREIIARLEADMEWQKRERVFNLRKARLTHEYEASGRNTPQPLLQYNVRGGNYEVPDWTREKDPFLVGGVLENNLD